jgi:rhamnose utilization protein RhaD (predicted bifunctional aldolase and dehydrogenase)
MEGEIEILDELVILAHELGAESRELAILGEGNLSADITDGTFWVKSSGSNMASITPEGFSRVRFDVLMELAEKIDPTEEEIVNGLRASLVGAEMKQPSIETFLHAVGLKEAKAKFIAHTHPTAVLSILCSKSGAEPFLGHIFPEPIPICGVVPGVVPYVDPGFALAKAFGDSIRDYQDTHGVSPKTLFMINHGLVALGGTAQEALNITLIADKWARILLGTNTNNGPQYLSDEQVSRFAERLDEKLRQEQL